MVYFMQSPDGGPIKIGCTIDLLRRHAELQKFYGTKLGILKVINGGKATERRIHKKFAHLRIPRTEQFEPEEDLCDYISKIKADQPVVASEPVKPMKPVDGNKVMITFSDDEHLWLRVSAVHANMTKSKFIVSLVAATLKEKFYAAINERLAQIEECGNATEPAALAGGD